jgi:lysozyme
MTLGLDIHPVYQEHIDWTKLDPKVKFLWLKVSDGNSPYSKLQSGRLYTSDAHAKGILSSGRLGGGYHYAQITWSPESQAAILAREVRRLGLFSLPPALDLEAPFVPGAAAKDFGRRFIIALRSHGFDKVAIYGYTSMLQAIRPDLWDIPGLIIWASRPGPIGELGIYKGRTDVHQYTSAGHISGIAEAVDCNETLNDKLLGPPPAPTPTTTTLARIESMSYTAVTLGTFGQTGFKSGVRFDDGTFVDITDDNRAMNSSQANVNNKVVPVINCENPEAYDRFTNSSST